MAKARTSPPVVVIFGDEAYQKSQSLTRSLNDILPRDVDRGMALCEYDGSKSDEQGGPSFASVADDLNTLPFLTDRRVVVIRDADTFISRFREQLERYVASPSAAGTLVLECRTFPKTTRLHKAVVTAGGLISECRKLSPRDAIDFVMDQARANQKRIDGAVAARLVDLVGAESGLLVGEVEKLSLYVADRPAITDQDITVLVGQSREEKIFAVMDAAIMGNLAESLKLWQQVLTTDRSGIFKSLGGMAFVTRRLLAAHRMAAEGMPMGAIAPKLLMFRRDAELARQLKRVSPDRLQRLLADMAELDMKVKLGQRSLEHGIERLLAQVAAAA